MFRDRRTAYPVVDAGRVVGIVRLEDVRDVPESDRGTTRLRDIAETDVPRLDGPTDAFDGFVQVSSAGGVALVEEGGRVVGTVSSSDFASVMQLRSSGAVPGPRGAL
jgi:CBS domain-containing protein